MCDKDAKERPSSSTNVVKLEAGSVVPTIEFCYPKNRGESKELCVRRCRYSCWLHQLGSVSSYRSLCDAGTINVGICACHNSRQGIGISKTLRWTCVGGLSHDSPRFDNHFHSISRGCVVRHAWHRNSLADRKNFLEVLRSVTTRNKKPRSWRGRC